MDQYQGKKLKDTPSRKYIDSFMTHLSMCFELLSPTCLHIQHNQTHKEEHITKLCPYTTFSSTIDLFIFSYDRTQAQPTGGSNQSHLDPILSTVYCTLTITTITNQMKPLYLACPWTFAFYYISLIFTY